MAKLRGPIVSGLSGRLGQSVFAPMKGGEYVARAYNPQVKNPNTFRQQVSRNKMAMASSIAAGLSLAIKIGYAAMASSGKMFARNIFVKRIIPVSSGILTNDGTTISADLEKLPVSGALGIVDAPVLVSGEGSTANHVKVSASNAASVVLDGGETLGLVVCVINEDATKSIVRQGIATEGVEFSEAELQLLGGNMAFGFFKAIPIAKNGVLSTQEPWMYPSVTGPTAHLAL